MAMAGSMAATAIFLRCWGRKRKRWGAAARAREEEKLGFSMRGSALKRGGGKEQVRRGAVVHGDVAHALPMEEDDNISVSFGKVG